MEFIALGSLGFDDVFVDHLSFLYIAFVLSNMLDLCENRFSSQKEESEDSSLRDKHMKSRLHFSITNSNGALSYKIQSDHTVRHMWKAGLFHFFPA